MAIIAPFKGLTYNFDKQGDISKLVAPPYDVISEEEQEEYYQKDTYNVIRLILGKKKTGDSDWDNMYTRAADFLKRWESEDVIIRSENPSMYLSSLTYNPGDGGGPRIRWGLITLVHIEDEGSGVILPHERTFSAHKVDRLKLMRACRAQLSQVFGLYNDTESRILSYFTMVINTPPKVSFELTDGTRHQMWLVQDQSIFKSVADALYDKPIFIADGHHRYETARDFRNIMRARYGRRPPNRSYEYLMMYLTNMDDRGLMVLPSHRLLKQCEGFEPEPFFNRLRQWFDIGVLPYSNHKGLPECSRIKESLEEKGRSTSAIGFHYQGDNNYYLLSLKPEARDEVGGDSHPSLKKLDVLVLSRLIFQRALDFSREDLDNEKIFHYHSDMATALSLVDSGVYHMAFLLNPTKIDHMKEVASDSLIMPRKSTYFYPKVLTGLVFNTIDPNEIIAFP
jgi:uncharacterized protein (DUF1015 family)